MFPAESFGVGVTVADVGPAPWDVASVPVGVVSTRPTRLGVLLPVASMTAEQKALQLQAVEQAEAVLAAYRTELVVGWP